MISKANNTICPKCQHTFPINDNRTYQVKSKYAPFWFFDAVRQFEKFNEVKCPYCEHKYKAKEARLFLFFKSPYTVFVLCLIFVLFAIVITLKLSMS